MVAIILAICFVLSYFIADASNLDIAKPGEWTDWPNVLNARRSVIGLALNIASLALLVPNLNSTPFFAVLVMGVGICFFLVLVWKCWQSVRITWQYWQRMRQTLP